MGVVVNNQTGLAENLGDQEANNALSQGTHSAMLMDPQGNPVQASVNDVPGLLKEGHSIPTTQQYGDALDYAKYSSPEEQAGTVLQGLSSMSSFGLSNLIGDKEANAKRREINPGMYAAGELGALFTPSAASEVMGKAGETLGELATGFESAKAAKEAGLIGRIGYGAARGAAEAAVFQSSDEMSKMILDPDRTVGTAASEVGLAALLGGGIGGSLSGAAGALEAAGGSKIANKVSEFVGDAKGRLKQALSMNPTAAVSDELSQRYLQDQAVIGDVYGEGGLKAKQMSDLMPEFSDKIGQHALDTNDAILDQIQKMKEAPERYPSHLVGEMEDQLSRYQRTVAEGGNSPEAIFNATEELKRWSQAASRYGKKVDVLNPAKKFIEDMRGFGSSLRESLEDSDVWGKAGDFQKSLNEAISQHRKPMDQIASKFFTDVNGADTLNPKSVETFVNQQGKSAGEIRRKMMGNYIESSDKLRDTVNGIYSKFGVESPIAPSPMTATKSMMEDLTPGARFGDEIIKKGLPETGARAAAGVTGGVVGGIFGHPIIGAWLGERTLTPLFKAGLPAVGKLLLEKEVNPTALRGTLNYLSAAAKGEANISKAVKNLFAGKGAEILSDRLYPKESNVIKLDKMLKAAQAAPFSMGNTGTAVAHYMPNHAQTLGTTAANAIQYLNSIRPDESKPGPLDPPRKPSKLEKLTYERQLNLAEQPMLIFDHIKDGSLTQNDINTLAAVYPNFLSSLKQRVGMKLVDHASTEGSIPYKSRLTLSAFLGMPLESSIMPHNALVNQMALSPPMNPQQGGKQAPNHFTKPFKDAPSMEAERPANQAREAQKAKPAE